MASCFVAPPTRPSARDAAQPDLQAENDGRGVPLSQVGIRGFRHPVPVLCRDGSVQTPMVEWTLASSLPAERRGTHMSRLVSAVQSLAAPLAPRDWPGLAADLRDRLDADHAEVTASFPLALSRRAPVTGLAALAVYDVVIRVSGTAAAERFSIEVNVPLSTVCPCSKAISDYGAHNQRAYARVELVVGPAADHRRVDLWPEELVAAAEEAASAPVYPLLKRPDERAVTMQAFDRPMFVEDVARTLVTRWRGDVRVAGGRVEVESLESIHAHNAFAVGEWDA